MTIETPTQIPESLVSGDTWSWERELSDYPASTYTAAWYFENSRYAFSVTAGVDGSKHTGAVTAANSATYPAGRYKWTLVVTKVSDSTRTTVEAGYLDVTMNPAASGMADRRSHARKVLEAIEAVIEGRATNDQLSYSLNGRSLERTPIADLLTFRDKYKAEAAAEDAAERIALGLRGTPRVLVRF